jgi:transposase
MIVMNSKAQLTVDVIAKVAERKITIANAAKLLNKSRRTVERYLQRYRSQGLQFVVHGNTGSEPVNKTPDRRKQTVQSLIREKYYDLNLLHLAEMLETHEHIVVKRETLRKWAHDIHHVKRAKRRRSRVHKRRERMEAPGLMLQMDGSTHRWFGDRKSCLIAMIDDANSDIHAEFFPSETTEGCMKVMRSVVEKYGVFKTLYVDRAGIFGGPKRCNFSQMQRACEELGIEIIFASSPQGKGRIERAFDTLQDRLIPELRLNKITDMTGANSYLQHVFIPQFWRKKLVVKSRTSDTEYTPVPRHTNLDDICITKVYRKIRNDHTFSYRNKFYFIESPLKHSIANQKIEIRVGKEKQFDTYFAGRKLQVSEVIEPTKASLEDIEIQKKLDVLALAEKLGNVAEASRLSGVSRETIYQYRKLIQQGGIEALKRQKAPNLHHKNRTEKATEQIVIEFSLANPHLGQQQISRQLKTNHSVDISPNGVRYIWLREKMNTMALRLAKLAEEQQTLLV